MLYTDPVLVEAVEEEDAKELLVEVVNCLAQAYLVKDMQVSHSVRTMLPLRDGRMMMMMMMMMITMMRMRVMMMIMMIMMMMMTVVW